MGYKDEELLRLRQKAEEFNKQRVSEDTLAEELKESIHDPVTHITKSLWYLRRGICWTVES